MISYGYLSQIIAGLLTLFVLKITYFFVKRRYTQSSVVNQDSTEESDICASRECALNESLSESMNLDNSGKMIYINNVTGCSGYGSIEDEMQESKNYTTTQEVLDTCILNSDSHSSILLWESCNEEISHSEMDFVNRMSSENHPVICQPLNLCMRDKINETGTNEKTRTYFTDRKHKNKKGIQKINSEKYLVTNMTEDYDQHFSLDYEKLKNLDYFENKKHSLNNDKLECNFDSTQNELKEENYLQITELSSLPEDEYRSEDTEFEVKCENNLETMKFSTIYQGELEDENNLNNPEHELEDENNLEITKLCSIDQGELKDEYNSDSTEYEPKDENNLQITELSSLPEDEYRLEDTEFEVKCENNLETMKLSTIYEGELEYENNLNNTEYELKDENNFQITELSSIPEDEYRLEDTEFEVKCENNLETTKLSTIYEGELEYENNLNNTEYKLKDENNFQITEIYSLHQDEYSLNNIKFDPKDEHNLEITKLSPIHHEELKDPYSLDNTEHSLNDDEVMLANNLVTTEFSPIHQNEQSYENNYLKSPELFFLNNDKSISGIDSPNIKFHHDYDFKDNTSSSEITESLPSPIFNNDSSIDDIQYVEDYNDISFFDPTLSDDAMNEAFVED